MGRDRESRRGVRGQPAARAGSPMIYGVAALLAALLVGFFWISRKPQRSTVHFFVGVDVSESMTQNERKRIFGPLDQVVDTVLPAHSPVGIWCFDNRAYKLFDGRPARARDLWKVEDDIITRSSAIAGTHPSTVLAEFDRTLDGISPTAPVALMLLWDGDDASPAVTRQWVESLAKRRNIRAVWVVGVPSEHDVRDLRIRVERVFAPFGARLVVSGPYDTSYGLQQFQQLVRKGSG